MKSAVIIAIAAGASASIYQPAPVGDNWNPDTNWDASATDGSWDSKPTGDNWDGKPHGGNWDGKPYGGNWDGNHDGDWSSKSSKIATQHPDPTPSGAYGAEHSSGPIESYVTEVLTAFTTFCPEATALTHGGKTYSVTKATTLTITDCPCTVTKPVYHSTTSVCTSCQETVPIVPVESVSSIKSVTPLHPVETTPVASIKTTPAAPVETTPAAPVKPNPATSIVPSFPAGNGTTPVHSPSGTPVGPVTTFTGAASKVAGVAGAGLGALVGLVAFVL